MLRCDRDEFLGAVEWVTRSICGEVLPSSATIELRQVDGHVTVEARCGERTAGTRLSAELVGDGLCMGAAELLSRLGDLDRSDGDDVVIAEHPDGLSVTVGDGMRTVRRLPPWGEVAGWRQPLVRIKADLLKDAVERVRTLSGWGLVHVEVGDERMLVIGVDERQAAAVPVELEAVDCDAIGVQRFSLDGVRLETAVRGLRGTVALTGVWLARNDGRHKRDERPERAPFDQLRLSDRRSTAVVSSVMHGFPAYGSLLQSGPGGAVEVDSDELRRVVAHVGAMARVLAGDPAVVELRPWGDEVVVMPVVGRGGRKLDARSVDAVLHGDLPGAVRYRADDLATALATFDTDSVTIFVDGSNGRATIVEDPGRWYDEGLARRSVAAVR